MKILFIAKGDRPDLECDAIFHGARSLFGADFVDINRAWYMYAVDRKLYWNERIPNGGNSYGLGFYLNGTMPEDTDVDRTDILTKIKNRYFDCVIYGSATRCLDYLAEVRAAYPPNKILMVDGEDDQIVRPQYADIGLSFKRELVWPPNDRLFPIQFGTPKEKIVKTIPVKSQQYGTVIPGDMTTYIFKDEKSYYDDYQKSYFGLTTKKAGWDCGRHYEILMNGCIPFFPDLQGCPTHTMVHFPKDVLIDVANRLKTPEPEVSDEWYFSVLEKLLEYTRDRLTTERVVLNMLNHVS
jgi:hypothetical protein